LGLASSCELNPVVEWRDETCSPKGDLGDLVAPVSEVTEPLAELVREKAFLKLVVFGGEVERDVDGNRLCVGPEASEKI
jgi:hypothetical protein